MHRQRVLLLENDGALESVRFELFDEERLEVAACDTLGELQASIGQYPRAAVVSDSWARGDYLALSPQHYAEIVALANSPQVVLTTGTRGPSRSPRASSGLLRSSRSRTTWSACRRSVRVALERAASQFTTPAAACSGLGDALLSTANCSGSRSAHVHPALADHVWISP